MASSPLLGDADRHAPVPNYSLDHAASGGTYDSFNTMPARTPANEGQDGESKAGVVTTTNPLASTDVRHGGSKRSGGKHVRIAAGTNTSNHRGRLSHRARTSRRQRSGSLAAQSATTPKSATLKRLPFQIRLESMSARATKALLYITYLTLLVAVVLTATDKLNFDKVRGAAAAS